MGDGAIRRLLLDDGLIVDPRKDWNSIEQVAVISASNDVSNGF